ncbi:lactonase family protein [Flaviaesturariibacter amylovorans]|uniref:Lactonase family protein n=1 Tax=Flaviaesturariibacter amylovorans TaxID=1084520 RepID=A0ABP8GLR0_9BACT
MKNALLLLAFAGFSAKGLAQTKTTTLLVGTYTHKGHSTGIYTFSFNPADAATAPIDSAKASNPSFLVPAPNGRYVYAVNEDGKADGGGRLSAFRLDKGRLSFINSVPSQGDHPCYVMVDEKGRNVVVGNYSSGTVALFGVAPDGGVSESLVSFNHTGSGPNKARQEAPHVHATVLSPDGDYVLVPDLGTDKVVIYRISSKNSRLDALDRSVALTPGSGPRHLDFHPNGKWAYVTQELTGTVSAFRYGKGKLEHLQEISLLADSSRKGSSADIHVSPDGKYLYASNRNPTNHLAIFRIDQSTGQLTPVGHQPTGGLVPRNFSFSPDGAWLLVANQESDSITVFKVDKVTGLLTDTGKRVAVPSPVCLQWVEK